jgi:hypothetical protein
MQANPDAGPMVKKLILAVKEGEFPVVVYFAGVPRHNPVRL